jgi:hypothetical protein
MADRLIPNDGTMDEFKTKMDALAEVIERGGRRRRRIGFRGDGQQLLTVLSGLQDLGGAATPSDIAVQIEHATPILARNVNWILSKYPEYAVKRRRPDQLVAYELTRAGRTVLDIARDWLPGDEGDD